MQTTHSFFHALATAVLLPVLSSCSGSSQQAEAQAKSDPGSTALTYTGYISITEKTGTGHTLIDAGFFHTTLSDDTSAASLLPPRGGCSVSNRTSDGESTENSNSLSQSIQAGPRIEIKEENQIFATLYNTEFNGISSYAIPTDVLRTISLKPLSLNIQSPAATTEKTIVIDAVTALEINAPVWPEPLTSNTVFDWQPVDADTSIIITASHLNSHTAEFTLLRCEVPDSGHWVLPDAVKTALGEHFVTSHYELLREQSQHVDFNTMQVTVKRISSPL